MTRWFSGSAVVHQDLGEVARAVLIQAGYEVGHTL